MQWNIFLLNFKFSLNYRKFIINTSWTTWSTKPRNSTRIKNTTRSQLYIWISPSEICPNRINLERSDLSHCWSGNSHINSMTETKQKVVSLWVTRSCLVERWKISKEYLTLGSQPHLASRRPFIISEHLVSFRDVQLKMGSQERKEGILELWITSGFLKNFQTSAFWEHNPGKHDTFNTTGSGIQAMSFQGHVFPPEWAQVPSLPCLTWILTAGTRAGGLLKGYSDSQNMFSSITAESLSKPWWIVARKQHIFKKRWWFIILSLSLN